MIPHAAFTSFRRMKLNGRVARRTWMAWFSFRCIWVIEITQLVIRTSNSLESNRKHVWFRVSSWAPCELKIRNHPVKVIHTCHHSDSVAINRILFASASFIDIDFIFMNRFRHGSTIITLGSIKNWKAAVNSSRLHFDHCHAVISLSIETSINWKKQPMPMVNHKKKINEREYSTIFKRAKTKQQQIVRCCSTHNYFVSSFFSLC